MEPTYVLDWGHWTAKCGIVWTGRATSKAARSAASAGDSIVVHCPNAGTLVHSGVPSVDRAVAFIEHVCQAAAEKSPKLAANAGQTDGATLILLIPIDMTRWDMEALCSAAFERLHVKRLHLAPSSTMALLASGVTSGIVLDAGHFSTRVVPVLDSLPCWEHVRVLDNGGWHQSGLLRDLLCGCSAPTWPISSFASPDTEADTLHECKRVAPWAVRLSQDSRDTVEDRHDGGSGNMTVLPCTLPDGTSVEFHVNSTQLDDVATSIFDLRRVASHLTRPANLTLLAATKLCSRGCVADGLVECMRHVVLAGGPSAIPHADDALSAAFSAGWSPLPAVSPPTWRPIRDKSNASWIGASIFGQLSSFSGICVDQALYDRDGPRSVAYCTS